MKIILLILTTFFLCSLSVAEDFWKRTTGPDKGSVHALAAKGNLIYAATDSGVYISSNEGLSWIKTGFSNQSVSGLAISTNGYIFATTPTSWRDIYQSTDDGSTWNQCNVGLPIDSASRDDGHHTIVVSQKNNVIYLGTSIGIFRSVDDGSTWTQSEFYGSARSLFVDANGGIYVRTTSDSLFYSPGDGSWSFIGPSNFIIESLAIDPAGIVYLYGYPPNQSAFKPIDRDLLLSKDAGKSWQYSGGGYWYHSVLHGSLKYLIATGNGTVFAGAFDSVYESIDEGHIWSQTRSGLDPASVVSFAMNKSGSLFAGTVGSVYKSSIHAISVEDITIKNSLSSTLEQNYPNPFSGLTTIGVHGKGLFEVRDILGRVVFQKQVDENNREIRFDGSRLSKGLYQYSLSDGVNVRSRMMMVVH